MEEGTRVNPCTMTRGNSGLPVWLCPAPCPLPPAPRALFLTPLFEALSYFSYLRLLLCYSCSSSPPLVAISFSLNPNLFQKFHLHPLSTPSASALPRLVPYSALATILSLCPRLFAILYPLSSSLFSFLRFLSLILSIFPLSATVFSPSPSFALHYSHFPLPPPSPLLLHSPSILLPSLSLPSPPLPPLSFPLPPLSPLLHSRSIFSSPPPLPLPRASPKGFCGSRSRPGPSYKGHG